MSLAREFDLNSSPRSEENPSQMDDTAERAQIFDLNIGNSFLYFIASYIYSPPFILCVHAALENVLEEEVLHQDNDNDEAIGNIDLNQPILRSEEGPINGYAHVNVSEDGSEDGKLPEHNTS